MTRWQDFKANISYFKVKMRFSYLNKAFESIIYIFFWIIILDWGWTPNTMCNELNCCTVDNEFAFYFFAELFKYFTFALKYDTCMN